MRVPTCRTDISVTCRIQIRYFHIRLMKTLLAILSVTIFAITSFAQGGWEQQQSNNPYDLFYVQFTSKDTGYISGIDYDGNGYLYRTTDQGNTWLPFGPPGAGGDFFF